MRATLILAAAAAALLSSACTPESQSTASTSSRASGLQWSEDYAAASRAARERGKPILVDFTGSDWCTWCIRLDREVFETPAFREWAGQNVVLLKLDFPRGKQLAPALKEQNHRLARKYQVRGFPTILFLDADGKRLGEMGYVRGGPAVWTEKASQIIARAK